jgi:hypothetical protein
MGSCLYWYNIKLTLSCQVFAYFLPISSASGAFFLLTGGVLILRGRS